MKNNKFLLIFIIIILRVAVVDAKEKIKMVLIPAGSFLMGDTRGNNSEKPVHKVYIDSFYMDKHEVTQEDFEAMTGFNPSRFEGDNLSVEQVRRHQAAAYGN